MTPSDCVELKQRELYQDAAESSAVIFLLDGYARELIRLVGY